MFKNSGSGPTNFSAVIFHTFLQLHLSCGLGAIEWHTHTTTGGSYHEKPHLPSDPNHRATCNQMDFLIWVLESSADVWYNA